MLACWKVIQWMPVAFPITRYSFWTVHPPPGEGWNFQTSPSHIHHQSLPFVGTTGCPWQYGPQVPHEITGRSSGSAPSSGSSPQAPRLSGWWLSLPRFIFTLLFTTPQSRAPRQRSTTKSTAPPQVVSIPLDLGSQPPCSQPVKKAQSLQHCKEPPNSMKWLSFLFEKEKTIRRQKCKPHPAILNHLIERIYVLPNLHKLLFLHEFALGLYPCIFMVTNHLPLFFSFPVRYCTPKSHFRQPVSWISIPTVSVTDFGHPISLLSTWIPTSCCSQCWKIAPTAKFIVL